MLSSPSLFHFVENTKSENVLCGRLLPVNNNNAFIDSPHVSTTTVVEEQNNGDNKVIAFGALHVYTSNQAYFMLSECSPQYKDKFVTVERCDEPELDPNAEKSRHHSFKITEVFDDDFDNNRISVYHGAFGKRYRQSVQIHVYDNLVSMTSINENMDVKKNVTLDLYDPDEFDIKERTMWRDRTGFLVSDTNRFFEVTISTSDLITLFNDQTEETSQVVIKQLARETMEDVQDYDSSMCIFSRQDYLDFILDIKELRGVVAVENNQPVGYALVLGDRLIQCYADNASIAKRLAVEMCAVVGGSMTMFLKECSEWHCEEMFRRATRVRRVQRIHTRVSPSQVEWSKVFALNIGVHLF